MVSALEAAGATQLTVRGLPEAAVAGLVADAVAALPGPGLLAGISGAAGNPLLDRDHDRSVTGAVRICLGHAQLALGQASDALRDLDLAASSPDLAGHERTTAQAWASYARLALGDLEGASAVAQAARSAAVSAGDHLSTSIAMASLALVCEFRGQLGDALQLIDEAVRLADQSPGRTGHRYPLHAIRGWLLIELDRPQDARAALCTGRQLSEDLGVRRPLPTYQVFLAFARFIGGDWDDALTELEAGFELAEEIGEIYSRVYAHGVLSLISFHRNDLSRADAAASAAARDLAGRSPGYRMTLAGWPRALILQAGGDSTHALATLAGAWDTCARLGLVLEYPAVGADLVRLALAAGDTRRARAASAAVTEVASGNDMPWITGAALHCQGLIADDAELLQAAAAAYARGSRPLQLALACEDAGASSARQGDMERARPLFDQALAIYERLHATRDLARAEAVPREAGIRRGRRGTRDRPQAGWPSLTPAERAVAALVAEGLSNPQIGERLYVSRRTVQTHIAHVFAKLDLSSRAHLAAEVTRQRGSQRAVGASPIGA
jgi:DNA-binding CsgD family transcriptional regulator